MDNFFVYDSMLYMLYSENNLRTLEESVVDYLKKLVPHDYASILLTAPSGEDGSIRITGLYCKPGEFLEAEKKYIDLCRDELVRRLALTGESSVVRLSSVESESERLQTRTYRECYSQFGIYDILQLSVRKGQDLLAVVSLFRTRESGAFADDDVYLLKALGKHLGQAFYRLCRSGAGSLPAESAVEDIGAKVHLTPKEKAILRLVFMTKSNEEICTELNIREHTLQKHFQNIYRKLNVSSRWELLRLASDIEHGEDDSRLVKAG